MDKGKWKSLSVSDSLLPHGLYSPWNSPGHSTGEDSLSLLQGIFPTHGLDPGLLHCRWILYQLNHQESTRILEWVGYLFSSGSSQPRDGPGVSCIAGRFFTDWAIREAQSHSVVSHSLWPRGLYSPWNSPGQNTGVGSLFLLWRIFPTQGSNPGSPALQADSLPTELPGKLFQKQKGLYFQNLPHWLHSACQLADFAQSVDIWA